MTSTIATAAAQATGKQTLVIKDWVPAPLANGSHGHWSQRQKKIKAAKTMAWACARYAGWAFVPGRVRLTIVYVFPVNRKRDTDNLYTRSKGLVDGLKGDFFTDDDTEHLELVVLAVVLPKTTETRLMLEPFQ